MGGEVDGWCGWHGQAVAGKLLRIGHSECRSVMVPFLFFVFCFWTEVTYVSRYVTISIRHHQGTGSILAVTMAMKGLDCRVHAAAQQAQDACCHFVGEGLGHFFQFLPQLFCTIPRVVVVVVIVAAVSLALAFISINIALVKWRS